MMEFDSFGGRQTNFEGIKQMFASAGYEMPTLIFWNVNGRLGNVPANVHDKVGLVSGFSPAILTSILGEEIGGPEQLMLKALMSERYEKIN